MLFTTFRKDQRREKSKKSMTGRFCCEAHCLLVIKNIPLLADCFCEEGSVPMSWVWSSYNSYTPLGRCLDADRLAPGDMHR